MKPIKRREFLSAAAQSIAGAGFIVSCDRRSPVGEDIRLPSAPKGFTNEPVEYDLTTKRIVFTWEKHDLTDITGAPSETGIKGYNIYGKDEEKPINTIPITETTYTIEDAFTDNQWYAFQITVIDNSGNESPKSQTLDVFITKPSEITKVTSVNATTANKLNPAVIKTMVHTGIMSFTNKANIGDAYKSLFSGITDKSIIAIKINCLAGGLLSTHPAVINAIIDGLKQMTVGQTLFPLYNIIVFDDRPPSMLIAAGFTMKNEPGDYRCVSTENNWSDTIQKINNTEQRLSKVVEEADYIINVPILKNHTNAGITFSLKNFFGIIDKPQNMHADMCDPFVAMVYKLVADKVVIIIGDAVLGAHKGGPSTSPTFLTNSIYISKDPVAIDKYAFDVINNIRKTKNMALISIKPDTNQADARHLITAGTPPYSLGKLNYTLKEITL